MFADGMALVPPPPSVSYFSFSVLSQLLPYLVQGSLRTGLGMFSLVLLGQGQASVS